MHFLLFTISFFTFLLAPIVPCLPHSPVLCFCFPLSSSFLACPPFLLNPLYFHSSLSATLTPPPHFPFHLPYLAHPIFFYSDSHFLFFPNSLVYVLLLLTDFLLFVSLSCLFFRSFYSLIVMFFFALSLSPPPPHSLWSISWNLKILTYREIKAVNREDKRSRRYRDQDFAKFERSRRYRDR